MNRLKKTKKRRNKTKTEELFLKMAQRHKHIQAKLDEIDYWRAFASKAESIFSVSGKDNVSGAMRNRGKIEQCVCRVMEIEESLSDEMSELIDLKEEVRNMIKKIEKPEYKSLLIHRYLHGKKWADVAEAIGYSYVHTAHRMHLKALEEINRIGDDG